MAGRKKLDRTNLHARVAQGTGEKLKEIAQNLGYVYDDEGSTGQLLDALAKLIEDIANGEIILILSNKSSVISKNS
jgi:DNA invertase Pin-like site-specific DNA recombinase